VQLTHKSHGLGFAELASDYNSAALSQLSAYGGSVVAPADANKCSSSDLNSSLPSSKRPTVQSHLQNDSSHVKIATAKHKLLKENPTHAGG